MLMWYIIFVLLILFTGGGLLYLGTRAAKFVPAGSTPKRRLLIRAVRGHTDICRHWPG